MNGSELGHRDREGQAGGGAALSGCLVAGEGGGEKGAETEASSLCFQVFSILIKSFIWLLAEVWNRGAEEKSEPSQRWPQGIPELPRAECAQTQSLQRPPLYPSLSPVSPPAEAGWGSPLLPSMLKGLLAGDLEMSES